MTLCTLIVIALSSGRRRNVSRLWLYPSWRS